MHQPMCGLLHHLLLPFCSGNIPNVAKLLGHGPGCFARPHWGRQSLAVLTLFVSPLVGVEVNSPE